MAMKTPVAALFKCILLLSFILSSTAAAIPDSDLPFEFNLDKGSVVTEDNVLVNAVSSDGKTVFKTNDPQPIKKYQSSNMQNAKQSTKPSYYTKTQSYSSNNNNPNKIKSNKNQMTDDYDLINSFYQPVSQTTSSYALPSMNDQWDFFQNFNKLIPGMSNFRITYY